MIALDSSALMAIVLGEPEAEHCKSVIQEHDQLLISAATLAETLIVATRRGVGAEMERLVDGLGMDVVPVTLSQARAVASAFETWGKGRHAAALNFGDCFAYALSAEAKAALLFVGNDFALTHIAVA